LGDTKQLDGAKSSHVTKPFPNSGESDAQIISAYKLQNSLPLNFFRAIETTKAYSV